MFTVPLHGSDRYITGRQDFLLNACVGKRPVNVLHARSTAELELAYHEQAPPYLSKAYSLCKVTLLYDNNSKEV